MAITGTDRGTGNNNTSATTFTLSPSGNFAANSKAVLVLANDNSGGGGATQTITVTDTIGNTWIRRQSPTYDPGAANAGVEGSFFECLQNVGPLQTGTTITVTFTNASTAEAWTLMEIIPTSEAFAILYVTGGVGTGSATATPTVLTGTITNGNMVIGGLFNEQGTGQTVTQDGDTTNGNWSTQQTNEIGTTAAGMTVSSQRKVVTSTATQTFNPTLGTSSDVILGWVEYTEVLKTAYSVEDTPTVTPPVKRERWNHYLLNEGLRGLLDTIPPTTDISRRPLELPKSRRFSLEPAWVLGSALTLLAVEAVVNPFLPWDTAQDVYAKPEYHNADSYSTPLTLVTESTSRPVGGNSQEPTDHVLRYEVEQTNRNTVLIDTIVINPFITIGGIDGEVYLKLAEDHTDEGKNLTLFLPEVIPEQGRVPVTLTRPERYEDQTDVNRGTPHTTVFFTPPPPPFFNPPQAEVDRKDEIAQVFFALAYEANAPFVNPITSFQVRRKTSDTSGWLWQGRRDEVVQPKPFFNPQLIDVRLRKEVEQVLFTLAYDTPPFFNPYTVEVWRKKNYDHNVRGAIQQPAPFRPITTVGNVTRKVDRNNTDTASRQARTFTDAAFAIDATKETLVLSTYRASITGFGNDWVQTDRRRFFSLMKLRRQYRQ